MSIPGFILKDRFGATIRKQRTQTFGRGRKEKRGAALGKLTSGLPELAQGGGRSLEHWRATGLVSVVGARKKKELWTS